MISDITLTISSEFVRALTWFVIGLSSGVLLIGYTDAWREAKARKARLDQAKTRF